MASERELMRQRGEAFKMADEQKENDFDDHLVNDKIGDINTQMKDLFG